VRLDRANEQLGFWVECGFIDFDRGNLWPRQYTWRCGCIGVSADGENVIIAPCDRHPEMMDSLPDGSLYVEEIRKQLASRVRPMSRFESSRSPGGLLEQDRRALIHVFDKGRRNARLQNKGQGRSGAPRGVPDPSDQQNEGNQD